MPRTLKPMPVELDDYLFAAMTDTVGQNLACAATDAAWRAFLLYAVSLDTCPPPDVDEFYRRTGRWPAPEEA